MRLFGKMSLAFLAIAVALYAAFAYGFRPLGSLVHPDMKSVFQIHSIGIYTHVFASIVALVLGPFQFSARLRQRYLSWHRWAGRSYLSVGVMVGGLSGLYMAQFAYGGWPSRAGFSLLALCWLGTGLLGYMAIRRRDIEGHRRWMMRNYALTFAAVTLRIEIGLCFASGLSFQEFYPWLAWLCWVPNLLVAEWLITAHAARHSSAVPGKVPLAKPLG